MQNEKLSSLLESVCQCNEKVSKIKNKIKIQVEEINKTKDLIAQFQDCLAKQNEVLNRLTEDKKTVNNEKKEFVRAIRNLDKDSDDEMVNSEASGGVNCPIDLDLSNPNCGNVLHTGSDSSDGIEIVSDKENQKSLEHESKKRKVCLSNPESVMSDPSIAVVSITTLFRSSNIHQITDVLQRRKSIYVSGRNGYVFRLHTNNSEQRLTTSYAEHELKLAMVDTLLVALGKRCIYFFDGGSNYSPLTQRKFDEDILDVSEHANGLCVPFANGVVWFYGLGGDWRTETVLEGGRSMLSFVMLPDGCSLLLTEDRRVFLRSKGVLTELPHFHRCDRLQLGPNDTVLAVSHNKLWIYRTSLSQPPALIDELQFADGIKFVKCNAKRLVVVDGAHVFHIYNARPDCSFPLAKRWRLPFPMVSAIFVNASDQIIVSSDNFVCQAKI